MSAERVAVTLLMWVLVALLVSTIFLAAVGYRMRESQNHFLYFPNVPAGSTFVCDSPLERGYRNSEQVHIRTADGLTLRGFIMWPPMELQERPRQQHYMEERMGYMLRVPPLSAASDRSNPNPPFLERPEVSGAGSAHPQCSILYFHGNAGNVGHRIPIAAMLSTKCRCAVLMVDYRGYGQSDSVSPTQEGVMLDAQACLDYLLCHPHIPADRIFVMGTSLGGAVAIHLAAEPHNAKHIAGVIVENTFTSIGDMASEMARHALNGAQPCFSFLLLSLFEYYVKPLCLHIKWRSIDAVQKICAPMLFLSGLKDNVVPPLQMKKLYSKTFSTRSRRFVEYPEGDHNTLPLIPGYGETVNAFIQDVLRHREQLI
ncbi:Bem46-like serine peptidase [Trypanosoma brucei gambiense DAL972]|uniref:Bem46-like serine peptidase n=1 Tax=Trypanosoma brucei gambiense (strain MHOM/CI/86/DAL972) TaxID=679716 RepID=C9ZYS4_TRYB9|nr:Bem46-like serine peptidase [Trypanosoma brucei gambiense DAL972]CBH14573.1 Bem46-like serine peptidase [Trypanosoma brucei gambiense DAL972]|eukprot:XP_011776839.1 Bem46-like serine peptidase [Trypanosoma brucei gambiense DAL972]